MSSTILVIHGPNLNLLGKREPEVYGYLTLDDINQQLTTQAEQASFTLDTFQSNWEGAIVDRIRPAVEPLMAAETGETALLNQAVRANIHASVNHLRQGSNILENQISNEGLQIVGAEYSLVSGAVEFLDV